ncbi:MAG: hypothetical protein P4M11_03390 [Candidatus Pacebacteria bacterium]|nr:hypothetical protein [Candidatus Paceibacterota bacterium]
MSHNHPCLLLKDKDGNENKIFFKELEQLYLAADKNGEASIALTKAYNFLRVQHEKCTQCNRDATSEQLKYILPCWCTLCLTCWRELEVAFIESDAALKKLRCKTHGLPLRPNRIMDTIPPTKQRKMAVERGTAFCAKRNLLLICDGSYRPRWNHVEQSGQVRRLSSAQET